VRLGLTLPSFVDNPSIPLTVARVAEEAGIDGVFVYDHLFRTRADGTRRPALEGVALLGAVADATSRVAVGGLVFRASLRPPASLAAAIASAERIAPGRVIATIGTGDSQSRDENETFGLGFGTKADRVAALEAAVGATRRATSTRVWVGGNAAAVRRIASSAADGWNSWGTSVERFRDHAAEVRAASGRGFECSWGGLIVVADDDAGASAKAERLGAAPTTIVGGPEMLAEGLLRYADAGADWVVVGPLDSSEPDNARLLGERVAPLLKDAGPRTGLRPRR
jgi:alkanesulfonate monooxygenase SsuD/methylene tetrahydromethanopterin reductase-like flavin-dependent oxidoreductase (luciferase family)